MLPRSRITPRGASGLLYLACGLPPVATLCALACGGNWVLEVGLACVLGVPLLDLVFGQVRGPATHTRGLSAVPLVALGLFIACIGAGVWVAAQVEAREALALGIGVGLVSALGLNVAHVCGHERGGLARAASAVMWTLCGLGAFPVEHRAHHALYGTAQDPASARRDESVYAFLVRYAHGAWQVLLHAETRRLRHVPRAARIFRHRVVSLIVGPLLMALVASWALNSALVLLFLAVHACVALGMMGLGIYVGHYGLERERGANGKLAAGSVTQSWNDSHAGSKYVLLGVGEHSFHHAHPSRAFWDSQHVEDAPELPLPYSIVTLSTLIPPLWRRLMHARLEQVRTPHGHLRTITRSPGSTPSSST